MFYNIILFFIIFEILVIFEIEPESTNCFKKQNSSIVASIFFIKVIQSIFFLMKIKFNDFKIVGKYSKKLIEKAL